jgi:hypothetical protein
MTRKGKLSVVTQNYPYVVRVVVDDNAVLHWRFEEPAYAEVFIAEFGGELLPSLPTSDLAMMRLRNVRRMSFLS